MRRGRDEVRGLLSSGTKQIWDSRVGAKALIAFCASSMIITYIYRYKSLLVRDLMSNVSSHSHKIMRR